MENFDATTTQYDDTINQYIDANKDNQFNLETTAIAASRVFAIPQNTEAIVMAKKNPSIIKMWDVFQKNNDLQKATIDQIIEVQKASHAFIQLINKREMLQAAAIITVKNQLNTLNIENQQIYDTIKKLAGNVLARFNQLERHIEHVEAVASLTQWIQNLKWRKYNEDPHTKPFFRILEDFYSNSGKNFTLQNLESLKTALDQSEINPFDMITISDFTTTLVDELIEHDFNESMKHSPYDSKHSFDDINEKISLPFLSSLYLLAEEYNHLTKRRYPVDKIRDDIKQAALCYMKKDCGIDVSAQLEYYHLGIELLNGRRLIEFLDSPTAQTTKSSVQSSPSASPVEIDTSQERYKEYMDIVVTLVNDEETPGVIDDEEREMLKMKQKILKLTDEEVKKIEESVINNHQNKEEAERKYREEVKNVLADVPEITAKKRMRLDLSAQSFGVSPETAKIIEEEVIENINTGFMNKVADYKIIVRDKLQGANTISSKARIYLDLKIQELGLNKEIASECEKHEIDLNRISNSFGSDTDDKEQFINDNSSVSTTSQSLQDQLIEEYKTKSNQSQNAELSSEDKNKIRYYICDNSKFDGFIKGLTKWLESQKYKVQIITAPDGRKLLQISQGGFLRNVTGMASALNVFFDQKGTNLAVEIGSGKWLDKAAAGAVGMIIFAPLAITAGIGAWQQAKIPEKIFNYIDSQLSSKK